MRRRGLFRNKGEVSGIEQEFPFEIDAGTSFLIKNETNAAEQVFTYAEVIDGTYDTWLNGANGGVLEWRSNGNILVNGHATELVRLKSNSGNPYLNDYEQFPNLIMIDEPINMNQDWIITLILDQELYGGNQRLNLGVRGTGENLFALQLQNNGRGHFIVDRITDGTGVTDNYFDYPQTDVFKLLTFSKINGSFSARVNNSVAALNPPVSFYYTETQVIPENSILLGYRKISNYQHLKVLTGNLTSIDLTAYGQAIMTKYNIT